MDSSACFQVAGLFFKNTELLFSSCHIFRNVFQIVSYNYKISANIDSIKDTVAGWKFFFFTDKAVLQSNFTLKDLSVKFTINIKFVFNFVKLKRGTMQKKKIRKYMS